MVRFIYSSVMNQAYASNNAIDYTTHLMMKKDNRRNKSLIGWLSCFSIVLAAAGAVLYGILGIRTIQSNNPCKMTYTTRERSEIPIQSFEFLNTSSDDSIVERIAMKALSTPYKLWKISNPSKTALNYQPVLFIPGHMANADQVRSLSSRMHDAEGYFQFFSVDFSEEMTMQHGSVMVNQAYFVNFALRKIRSLYKKNKILTDQKIMIVAHSGGGIVARTAVLLSNHPKNCIVSDIILLSSPNQRAPYAVDSSLNILFNSVNKAWMLSFYNTSRECLHKSEGKANAGLTADFLCPVCVPQIRMVSFSGGEIDYLVNADLTLLQDFTPRPRNVSLNKAAKPVGSPTLSLLSTGYSFLQSVLFLPTKILIYSFNKLASHGSQVQSDSVNVSTTIADTKEFSVPDLNCSSAVVDGQCSNLSITYTETNDNNSSIKGPFSFVTEDSWHLHMLPFIEPQFLNIRTSQLANVGFPVDHNAILWCYQFISTVIEGMRKISLHKDADPNQGFELLSDAFPLKPEYIIDYNNSVRSIGRDILSLERYIARNESVRLWRLAGEEETSNFSKTLNGTKIYLLAFYFVTHRLTTIIGWYFVLAVLAITAPILRSLCGHTLNAGYSSLDSLHPWIHFSLDILFGTVAIAMQSVVPAGYHRGAIAALVFIPFVISAALVITFLLENWSPSSIPSRLLLSYLAYSVALIIYSALFVGLMFIHYVVSKAQAVCRVVLRWTIYCRPIRRFVRASKKYLNSTAQNFFGVKGNVSTLLARSFLPTSLLAIVILLWILGADRINGPKMNLGYVVFVTSIISIVAFVAAVIGIVLRLVNQSDVCPSSVNILMLYLPAIALGWSSFVYSLKLVIGDPGYVVWTHYSDSSLSALFGPEHIHYSIFITAIAYHLWYNSSQSFVSKSLPWLSDVFGPKRSVKWEDVWAFVIGSQQSLNTGYDKAWGSESVVGSQDCIHEDGGLNAIFELVQHPESKGLECVAVAPGVTLGSLYRVVRCSCSTNFRLKDMSEWCEWCRCAKCGGKGRKATSFHSSTENAAALGLEVSSSLFLLLSLIGLAAYGILFLEDCPYLYLHLAGGAAVAQVIYNIFPTLSFKL